MTEGLYEKCSEFRIDLTLNSTLNTNGSLTLHGDCLVESYEISSGALTRGFILYLDNKVDIGNTGQTTGNFQIPSLGINDNYDNGINGGIITDTYFTMDYKLTVTSALKWKIYVTTINWYVNGVLYKTYGPYTYTSTYVAVPGSMPIIGTQINVVPGCSYRPIPTSPPTLTITPYSLGSSADVEVKYRYKEGGEYISAPFKFNWKGFIPLYGVPCDMPSYNNITGTTMASIKASAHATLDATVSTETVHCPCPPGCVQVGDPQYYVHHCKTVYKNDTVSGLIVSNNKKMITKFEDYPSEFGELWYRSKLPQVKITRSSTCKFGTDPTGTVGTTISDSDTIDLYSYNDVLLSNVGDTAHVIEDDLLLDSYSLQVVNSNVEIAYGDIIEFVAGSGHCIVTIDCDGSVPCYPDTYNFCIFSCSEVVDYVQSGVLNGALDYIDASGKDHYIRYINSWPNAHWSYYEWEEDWLGYFFTALWGPRRQQLANNAALPVGEKTNAFNHIVAAPLYDSPFYATQIANFGYTWHLGQRIKTGSVSAQDVTLTSASSTAWTFINSSGAFASSITVTPTTTSPVVKLNVGSFTLDKLMSAHLATLIKPAWSGSNITYCDVYLVSSDGTTKVKLTVNIGDAHTTSGVYQKKKINNDIKYAGSWGIENGQGVIVDIGSDTLGTGESLTVMSDVERESAFKYLADKTFDTLEFNFSLTNLTPFTLSYPSFSCQPSNVFLSRESGVVTDIILNDGPLVRFGNQDYGNGSIPPSVVPIGLCNSVVDLLCFNNVYLLGKASTTGIDTYLATQFDSVEGATMATMYQTSIAFYLPIGGDLVPNELLLYFLMANLYAQVPPCCQWPMKQFDKSTYTQSGDYVQESFAFGQKRSKYVTDGTLSAHLFDGATQITTDHPLVVTGRKLTYHEYGLNSITQSYVLKKGGVDYAHVNPALGYDCVIPVNNEGGIPSYDVSHSHKHYRSLVVNGKLVIGYNDNALTHWNDLATSYDAKETCIRVKDDFISGIETVIVYVSFSGTIKRYTTTDSGVTLVSTTIATTNKDYPVGVISDNFTEYIYYVDSTTNYAIKGKIYDAAMNVIEAEFTILTSVNPLRIAGARSWKVGNELRISLLVADNGTLTQYVSSDGKNFS